MADNFPTVVRSLPGVKRDGTEFDGDNYIDAQWCRFQRGLPRKIGGYRSVYMGLAEKVYGMASYSSNAVQYQHLGSETTLLQLRLTAAGVLSGSTDRTPVALVDSPNNVWQFDVAFDTTGGGAGNNQLLAHPGQNLAAIDSEVETDIYYGPVTSAAVLAGTLTDPQSGGVVALAPYVLTYGNNGRVDTYDAAFAQVNSQNITGSKIIRGYPLRGGGAGPAGIFWSLDSVLRATFVDATVYFAFDTLSSESSVLSSRGIIEYDGIFYWAGVDRFMFFNGVVQELPNDMNVNYFFDGLNFEQRQKVFAIKIPRFGEIWWCYPRGGATECTHAVCYNIRGKFWYDTSLPGSGRSDGIFAKVYNKPFMVDVDLTDTGYTQWQHETGTDEVRGASSLPIVSYFETGEITLLTNDKPDNKSLGVHWFEPDFVQTGPLSLQITGRINARAPVDVSVNYDFPETASNANEQIIPLKETRRLMRFKITSNTSGGDYQMGQCIGHLKPADERMRS